MSAVGGKVQKPLGATAPKVRPTAASVARAARNATNRNLTQPQPVRSPTRSSVSPAKGKCTTQRNFSKTDSKTDFKANGVEQISSVESSNESVNQLTENDNLDINAPNKMHNSLEGQKHYDEPIVSVSERDFAATDFTIVDDQCKSRPQTPGSQSSKKISSRPATPGTSSRPSTPANPGRNIAPSRPNTPQHPQAPSRPKTPVTSHIPGPTRTQTPAPSRPSSHNDDDIKVVYVTKQRQFYRMKKELDFKQQAIMDVYRSLRDMHSQLSEEGLTGGGEGPLVQELAMFNVADWTTEEISQLCKDAAEASCSDNANEIFNAAMSIDENALAELNTKVQEVPINLANLCLQALKTRQELMNWLKELVDKQDDGSGESFQRIAYYDSQGVALCETLQELKIQSDACVETITQLLRRSHIERNTLISVGESLIREVARLRQDLEARVLVANIGRDMEHGNSSKEHELRRELEEEKLAKSALKDKLVSTESQLRQTRLRITKMDKQLREAEASIASLTGTVKNLEDQSRQKEVHLEARARKLRETLKTGEVTNSQLLQQRDSLQAKVQELEDQIKNLTSECELIVKDLNKKNVDLSNQLEEQLQSKYREVELKMQAESKLKESERKIDELTAKVAKLENFKSNSDIPTERELNLIADLRATKDTLRMMEEDLAAFKREKVRFLESFSKVTESDKDGAQQKLAAELMNKDEIMSKMQSQIRDLSKNIKLNEEKVKQYERFVTELQAHNRAIASVEDSSNLINYQDLQQEVMSLKMNLLDAAHRNTELSEMLAEKEQKLEQQDKTSRAQARVIKVREELINLLKNKETTQSKELEELQKDLERRMKIVEEVNKQIASKADEIQGLFATLECKQQQIHRLEKIVLALEEQQKRSQAQRTRHEEKIAALEHELADGNRRERKFLFF